ncbi:hypothetical protein Sjap_021751 [Stephania japonica]|uniref:AB hydrolase-1 domain-containing protein n=1 Tax=Stephania japonica TaxID=461633 RepID=A0AAP0HS06_9MAGN
MGEARRASRFAGNTMNMIMSIVVFLVLDVLEVFLCVVYQLLDFLMEAQWRPCYRSRSSAKEAITGSSANILMSATQLQLDHISNTLYYRPSMARMLVEELQRIKAEIFRRAIPSSAAANVKKKKKIKNKISMGRANTVTINSTVIEMILAKIGRYNSPESPRWSDCHCNTCNSWTSFGKESTLLVHIQGPSKVQANGGGFAGIWEEPEAQQLSLHIGRAHGHDPQISDPTHNLTSFHIVAHSLGCILALAIADAYPESVKSLTLVAPPYHTLLDSDDDDKGLTFLVEGLCHTHNAAWHTLHNVVCGSAGKLDVYLDGIRDRCTTTVRSCEVNVFHGRDDDVVPVECSYALQSKVPQARVNVINGYNHITIIVSRPRSLPRNSRKSG